MKILLCNNTLSLVAGSETYTYALAIELQRQGHDVSCFSFSLGVVSDLLMKKGIKCFNQLPEEKPDLIIANHFEPTEFLKITGAPIIFTLHSIYGIGIEKHPENPVEGAKAYIAISEEIQDIYTNLKKESVIIRNGIDLERFKEVKPRRKDPVRVLLNTNYLGASSILVQRLHEACNIACAELFCVGKAWKHVWDMENVYNDMDIVFSLGRGCLEAMACNRPAVVYGHNGVDGLITKDNFEELRKVNYSGRNTSDIITTMEIVDILTARKHDDFDYRELVKENDIKTVANQYLNL